MKKTVVNDILRSFFFAIDRAIYYLIEVSYELFHNLSGIALLDNNTFQRFTGRIYLLLGIFALFKLSFALIGMFVNPDSFSDQKTGGAKLVKKLITVLMLIVLVPTIFQYAFRLQSIVLGNNVIGTVILGTSSSPDNAKNTYENGGRIISTTVFKAFFRPAISTPTGTPNYSGCTRCQDLYENRVDNVTVDKYDEVLNSTNSSKEYIFDYNILVSSLAALGAAYLLIMFSFDVAIRSVKLTFLQLIAPIPIIMSLDPKKGEDTLKKWVSNTTKTYVDLFMRLTIIYFVIFIIAEITKNGGNVLTLFRYDSTGTAVASNDVGVFTTVFVIFGLLLFAKEAPNLIYELMGMKPPSGGFGLNPIKRLSSIPLLGGALGAGAALAGGMLGNVTKLGGSALKAGALKGLGQDAKAKKTLASARNRFANRSEIAKQEAYERYNSNKWGGNEKYSGTTISGYEQKKKNEAFQKKQEAKIDSNNRSRLYEKGKKILDGDIIGKDGKPMTRVNKNGQTVKLTYKEIPEITNSADMNAAFNAVYGNESFAASMTNVQYGKINLKNKNTALQIAIAKVNQNPGDQAAMDDYMKKAEDAKSAEAMLKGYEENHQKIRAIHKEQAELEDSIKIAKGPNVGQTKEFTASDVEAPKADTNSSTTTSGSPSGTTGGGSSRPSGGNNTNRRGSSRPQY